jgi:2-dehydro-3-deoxygluconokinase
VIEVSDQPRQPRRFRAREGFDVVVLGEVLLEVASTDPLGDRVAASIGISGDALNVAAAAASAGARVGLVSVLSRDGAGDAVEERIAELGISTALLRRGEGHQGVYFSHVDPAGEREFVYARHGSAGSTLSREHVDDDVLAGAGAVVASGITCAISESAHAAVLHASTVARDFVYDPNHRPRLRSADQAVADLTHLAGRCRLVTPSFPAETTLLGAATAEEAALRLQALGARAVAVTCGSEGVAVLQGGESVFVPSVPAPAVVDQTGAGDAFVGSTTARLVLGDHLVEAVAYGVAAASLVVSGHGGTGLVPTSDMVMSHRTTSAAR